MCLGFVTLYVTIHLSRRERKFFVLKNVILKNRKISEGTSRREFFNLFDFIIISYVLDMYFFSSFTWAKKRRKEVPRKEENQAGIRTLRVHYGSLNHCLQSKQLRAFSLYAHNCNEVAGINVELLNFRSKFLGLVPENLCTKIPTNSNW